MSRTLEGFTPDQVHEMWTKPGADGWYEFLQERTPERLWEQHGDTLKALCPWHNDTNPSLEFNVANKSVRCYVCNKYTRDLLPFLAEIATSGVEELYYELAQRFKYKTSAEMADRLRYETVVAALKNEFVRICARALSRAEDADEDYAYGSEAIHYLKTRNIDLNLLPDFGIGMLPTKGQVYQALSSHELRLEFETYFGSNFHENPNVTGKFGGWLVLPFYTSVSRVGRIKIKSPHNGKTLWLGPKGAEKRGFFGLNMFRTVLGSNAGEYSSKALIVEGEFDQLSLHQGQLRNHPSDLVPVLAGSGSAVEDIGTLKASGVKRVTLVGDNDQGGKNYVKQLLSVASQDKLHRISIFDWGHRYTPGADPDDTIQSGHYARLRADLLDPQYLMEPHQWASERVKEDLQGMASPTVKERVELAIDYGEILHDEIDFDLFQNECAKILNINPALLEKHGADIETQAGYIRAIERALERFIIPLVIKRTVIEVYKVKDRATQTLPFSPNRAWVASINSCLGMPMYDWVEKYVGIPDHVSVKMTKGGPQPVDLDHKMSKVQDYFDKALDRLNAKAGLVGDLTYKEQGYHFISENEALADIGLEADEPRQRHYLINGRDLFIGTEMGDELKWRQAKIPIHGAYLLQPEASERWSNHISIANLEDAQLDEPAEMFEKIYDVYHAGFRLKAHDLNCRRVAYFTMAASVLTANTAMTKLFFTAKTSSGKSTLMLGILSGAAYSATAMLEMSEGIDNYTSAGVMQSASGSSMVMCLDEFEDPAYCDGVKKRYIKDILDASRNMDTGSRRVRGTPSQKAKNVIVRFPLVCAGIHPFQDAVDANRFITIEMESTDGHVAPDVALVSKFGRDYFDDIRRWTTLYPIRHVKRYQRAYKELEQEILDEKKVDFQNSRSARLELPQGVVSKLCGHDYLGYMQEAINDIEKRLVASAVSEEEALFRAIMQTNAVTIENTQIKHSVITLLAQDLEKVHLANADLGVYWIPKTDVVVLYPDKLPTLLSHSPQFRTMTNTNQIYQLLSRHPFVYSDKEFFMKNPSVIRYLRARIAKPRAEELLYIKLSDLDYHQADKVTPLGLDEM